MHRIIKKIHMYVGLVSFCALVVFGIAGLTATFQARPEGRVRRTAGVRYLDFTAPANLSDKQVADLVYGAVRIPYSNPVPAFAVRRNAQHQLALDFYTVNGIHRVTVLEDEKRLRIEDLPNNLWQYFNNMHSATLGGRQRQLAIRLWEYYNEVAIWTLMGLALTGVYLWLASRPRFRWAQYSFAAGSGVFLLLYILTR